MSIIGELLNSKYDEAIGLAMAGNDAIQSRSNYEFIGLDGEPGSDARYVIVRPCLDKQAVAVTAEVRELIGELEITHRLLRIDRAVDDYRIFSDVPTEEMTGAMLYVDTVNDIGLEIDKPRGTITYLAAIALDAIALELADMPVANQFPTLRT